MLKTKSHLRLVDETDKPSDQINPCITGDACSMITYVTATLGIMTCLVDRISYRGERLTGLYSFDKRRIYLDKHLKGHDLQFVLLHELGHAILHPGKVGERYWQDAAYRKNLEDEADDWAAKMLKNLRRDIPKRKATPTLAQHTIC